MQAVRGGAVTSGGDVAIRIRMLQVVGMVVLQAVTNRNKAFGSEPHWVLVLDMFWTGTRGGTNPGSTARRPH